MCGTVLDVYKTQTGKVFFRVMCEGHVWEFPVNQALSSEMENEEELFSTLWDFTMIDAQIEDMTETSMNQSADCTGVCESLSDNTTIYCMDERMRDRTFYPITMSRAIHLLETRNCTFKRGENHLLIFALA